MKTKGILDTVYDKLDFKHGQLFNVIEKTSKDFDVNTWLNKGEWFTAAKRAGAEKIFFVDNNPVVVFAKHTGTEEEKINCFNKLWSLARPRILFLECEGELSVIDLAQKPIQPNSKQTKINSLETLNRIEDVSNKLQAYHRDNIESGKIFDSGRFGSLNHRADQSLITDLKIVRNKLISAGLKGDNVKYAHALIGRSIFIRYLEDRNILTKEYFKKVADQRTSWTKLLKKPTSKDQIDYSKINALYPRVLQDKEFTYAFYKSLSKDFNGDMFPDVDLEEKIVKIGHLRLIQGLIYGDVGIQKKLFFFSYKFDIIPLDLISSIYEVFYQSSSNEVDKKSKARQDGAYYTPSVLAEFVLSQVLTIEALKKKPKVLDPACGSGIFLIEAFRRMVRYAWKQKQGALGFNELKEILGKQISGIEVNEEAARITAFSLYLAMLHYLDPPSIQKHIRNGNKLPNLLVSESKSNNHFNSIRVENAFSTDKVELGKVDIIVGNPPWGAPGNKADKRTKERQRTMLNWCELNSYPIGDKEPSQAFLWRALDLLGKGGQCALLTSAGVLFKNSSTTQAFRKGLISQIRLKKIFNFTHVRKFFFKGAVSPFVMIHFEKGKQDQHPVEYWSAKQVIALKETQAVLFSKYDLCSLFNANFSDNKTWKVNWFGRPADDKFIKQLGNLETLERLVIKDKSGRGYQTYTSKYEGKNLGCKKTLKKIPNRYNPIIFSDSPDYVYNLGPIESYMGKKLIIGEGISEPSINKGRILARYEKDKFSFYRSIYGLKLQNDNESLYLLILGILWSSFARYYFFNTTANWGLWQHKILLSELLQLPITLNNNRKTRNVISVVNKLREYHPLEKDVMHTDGVPRNEIRTQRMEWEAELDKVVFDLYDFSEDQRDLIRDCCEVTLPFFYQPYKSVGVMPAIDNNDINWIQKYAKIFANRWKPYLNKDEVMRADVHIGASGNLIALEFYPADDGDNWDLAPKDGSWDHVLDAIGKALAKPMGTSQIVLDGVVHAISDDAIIIIKRNVKRFWTRSIAREDADSTLCKRMLETMPQHWDIE
jgi:type I restriction-modification system DNA methylase subunit